MLKKKDPEGPLAPSTMWGHHKKMVIYEPEAGPHQRLNLPVPLSWTSQPPELRNKLLFFISHSLYGIFVRVGTIQTMMETVFDFRTYTLNQYIILLLTL